MSITEDVRAARGALTETGEGRNDWEELEADGRERFVAACQRALENDHQADPQADLIDVLYAASRT